MLQMMQNQVQQRISLLYFTLMSNKKLENCYFFRFLVIFIIFVNLIYFHCCVSRITFKKPNRSKKSLEIAICNDEHKSSLVIYPVILHKTRIFNYSLYFLVLGVTYQFLPQVGIGLFSQFESFLTKYVLLKAGCGTEP